MTTETELTLHEKKRYVCENVRRLYKDREHMIDIAKTIQRAGCLEHIKENAEGCLINLDTLGDQTEVIVNQLYFQVKHKLDKNVRK